MLQITKTVEFTKEIDITITAEDISKCLITSPIEERLTAARELIADCTMVLKGIPDFVINQLDPDFCWTFSEFLTTTAGRFVIPNTNHISTQELHNEQ